MSVPFVYKEYMAKPLLGIAGSVMSESKIATFQEFVSTDALLAKVAEEFRSCYLGNPPRRMPLLTPEQIRRELLRLNEKWEKKSPRVSEFTKKLWYDNPDLWASESEDEDDLFMPPSKGLGSPNPKHFVSREELVFSQLEPGQKLGPPCHGWIRKGAASSKGKGAASSKGKGAAS